MENTNAGELIDSLKHPLIRGARALNTPSEREAQARYLVEGEDLVQAAVNCRAPVDYALLAEDPFPEPLSHALSNAGIPWYRTTKGLLYKIIGTPYETAVTAVAVVQKKQAALKDLLSCENPLVAVGERIQDPRNVGVLIRTADAAGTSGLILTTDSADPFSRQAVRSSRGAILRLPLCLAAHLTQVLSNLKEAGLRIISTSAHADLCYWDSELDKPCAIVFGNETTGVSQEVKNIADLNVRIPILGGAHSLNVAVAAGIVLYEAVRQRMRGES
jgi:TrmH family RNA methyltransferase